MYLTRIQTFPLTPEMQGPQVLDMSCDHLHYKYGCHFQNCGNFHKVRLGNFHKVRLCVIYTCLHFAFDRFPFGGTQSTYQKCQSQGTNRCEN